MATKEMKVCDVYGSTRKVNSYRVSIIELGDDGVPADSALALVDVDLCQRAVKRCKMFIVRGTTRPGSVKGTPCPTSE